MDKKATEDALDIVQGFIDAHIEDKDKAHISTYICKDELEAIIFLVSLFRSPKGEL
jgi:hypothetical protein